MDIRPNFITIQSQYGVVFQNLLITQSDPSSTLVVLFGGAGYSLDAPLFHFARKVMIDHKCDVLKLEYGYNVSRIPYSSKDNEKLINDSLNAVKQCLLNGYQKILFISKSMGTFIAGEVAKSIGYDKVQHLFLTPISSALPHILASSGMIIVGTNDAFVVDERIKQIIGCRHIKLELIENANHALEVDDHKKSLHILAHVTELYETFIKTFGS